MLVVDPPSIFFALDAMVRPLLPAATRKKGECIDVANERANRAAFTARFGPELAEWLLELMRLDAC